MEQLLGRIKSSTNTDTSRIALFSWSYGGDAAILFQQEHPEIDCLFGFSSIDFSKSFFLENKMQSMLKPDKLQRPGFLYYEEKSRLGNSYSENILHEANKANSALILFPKLWHGNFNYIEGHVAGSLNLPVVHPWSKPGSDAIVGYEAVCRLTLLRLQKQFKGMSDAELKKQTVKLNKKLPDGFIK